MSNLFLDDQQLDELTGIRRGSTQAGVKHSKYQLQASFLRQIGIAFIVNARGKPIVFRGALEARAPIEVPKPAWQPQILKI